MVPMRFGKKFIKIMSHIIWDYYIFYKQVKGYH